MHALCPHCRSTFELVGPAGAHETTCPLCGSTIGIDPDATGTFGGDPPLPRFARLELISKVGSGAHGAVYRARDTRLDRMVAVKLPRWDYLEISGARERFFREARSAAQLRHPAIVQILDVDEQDGVPYIVSEFVEGTTLADLAKGNPLPAREAAELVQEVAHALHYAHNKGIVHRDVKPSNIMMDPEGRPRVMDFGLAKRDAGEVTMTLDGQLLGTPAYMSPEQARGDAHRVDGRSDVYSLGVVLYELLTGSLPFRGPGRLLLHRLLNEEPEAPRTRDPSIPRDLETICLKAMAKEPEGRYATAAEMSRDLRRFLSGEPLRARPTSPLARLSRRAHRNPVVAALGAITAFSLTLSLFLIALLMARTGGGRQESAGSGANTARSAAPGDTPRLIPQPVPASATTITIVYGTEQQKWLQSAAEDFRKTTEGQRIHVQLVGMGSVEGAQAILDGPGKVPIHVWSPASSAYRELFEREWRVKTGHEAIRSVENLALTPMVFVMWKSRYDAFIKKYGKVGFQTIAEAMGEPDGWGSIADRAEWGRFKFAHTHPGKSNSGLLTLVLMAYEFSKKERGLTVADVTGPRFQEWLRAFEHGVARPGGSLTASTGAMMKEMVLRGPSQYDCLMVYENLAIDYLDSARQRWGEHGELTVCYPEPNIWNEHPYYILDVRWSDARQRKAAAQFLSYLMSEPVQRRALEHNFRPGNPAVPVLFPKSPLVRHAAQGLAIDLSRACEPPRADVITELVTSFRWIER